MNSKLLIVFAVSALGNAGMLAVPSAWASDGGNFSFAAGFDYSTGKYGLTNTTKIFSIPVAATYTSEPWVLMLTVPYVSITGTGEVVPGGRRSRASGIRAASKTQSGLGDVVAAATYIFYTRSDSDFEADMTGKVKLATADPGLGTGENDYAAQLDTYRKFDRYTLVGTLGYEIFGSPAGVDMNGVAYGVVGGTYQLSDRARYGAEMKLAQRRSAIDAEQRELVVYASHGIRESLNIRGYVLKGFADGSPDLGFGVLVSSDL